MKIIFKALTGFGQEREVYFDAWDLEKVQYAFLREKRVLLSNGQAIDGKFIQQILPDYNRTMGWNPEHVIDGDDLNEIAKKGIDREANRLLTISKERLHFLISNKRELEIGKNVKIPELESHPLGIEEETEAGKKIKADIATMLASKKIIK